MEKISRTDAHKSKERINLPNGNYSGRLSGDEVKVLNDKNKIIRVFHIKAVYRCWDCPVKIEVENKTAWVVSL